MANDDLKVLLVDDVDFFREVMRDYFKRTPVKILMAGSGLEAIEIAAREKPDLIYMDVAMPVSTGSRPAEKSSRMPVSSQSRCC